MRLVSIVVIALATAAGGLAQPQNGAGALSRRPVVRLQTRAELFNVRGFAGSEQLLVETPDATRSDASRLNNDLVDKAGVVPVPTRGYVLRSRVLVETESPQLLLDWAEQVEGATVASNPSAPGFWIVTVPSVRIAITAADLFAVDPAHSAAYIDMSVPKWDRTLPTDPGFPNQWHLNNSSTPIADVNAEDAWDLGFRGEGTVLGVIEAGFQIDHPDLVANYREDGSQVGGINSAHATSVAGIIAASENNGIGGVGVAPEAQVTRLLYGSASENADAFGFRNDVTLAKNNSWGPADNTRISYMSSLERAALENGVLTGRNGLGTIYVWAAGNGSTNDRVDYDPYASSRFTIAVGAIGNQDVAAYYNELGSSMMVVAHSSGNAGGIYTTTNGSGYTQTFGGTSASAPLATGVIGLMLEANPELTWRDVQHVLIESARKCDPSNANWTVNAAGHDIHYSYGFGAVEAHDAVTTAQTWVPVDPETVSDSGVIAVNTAIPDNDPNGLVQTFSVSPNLYVESVELILNVETTYVGDLKIVLTSPSGTSSILALPRGDPTDNYTDYIFTTFRNWGEESDGSWTARISDEGAQDTATWVDARLKVYGTEAPPPPPPPITPDIGQKR